ncbi:MAG: NADH-quinone oxidoreductase subunit H [Deltaproteobacteria bacterium]|nr:NADH-quinone oxidoreductase subunit H [Deltaproteobacteria bacterium]
MPAWLQTVLTSNVTWAVAALAVAYLLTLGGIPIYTWWERRGAGLIQRRPGPNRRGPYGLIQPIADAVKLAVKEDVVPEGAHGLFHALAPMLVMTVALTTFAVIPWSGNVSLFGKSFRLQVADLNFGLIYILAISSIGVYGVALAGWASNNKYSLLGGLRSAAQMISYEVAMGLAVACMFLVFQTVKLDQMIDAQVGPLWHWGVFKAPLAFLIFVAAAYAETNRVPFDLPEAESEIVAGYHTEYSSLRFGLFYMGEYVHMAITAAVTVIVFFGGWRLPWVTTVGRYGSLLPWFLFLISIVSVIVAWDTMRPARRAVTKGNILFALILAATALVSIGLGLFLLVSHVPPWAVSLSAVVSQLLVFLVKFIVLFWMFIWIRWTMPRMRYDQLMRLGWKVLLPIGLANLALTSVAVLLGWI